MKRPGLGGRRAQGTLAPLLLAAALLGSGAAEAMSPPSDRSIIDAVRSGDAPALRDLLHLGGRAGATDAVGTPAIVIAVLAKQRPVVEALLEADSSLVNASYRDGNKVRRTVLTASVFLRVPEITAALLHAGAQVEARDGSGSPALVDAGFTGDLDTVRVLLDAGADVNARSRYGNSALSIAAAAGHVEVARMLLDHGALTYPLDAWGRNAHANAASQIKDPARAHEMLALLAEHHAETSNVNRDIDAQYLAAVHRGDLAAVKATLARGADVNARRQITMDNGLGEALALAVPHLELMIYLLDHGVDPEAVSQAGFSALHVAAGRGGSPESVELLVRRGLDVNEASKTGATPLFNAVNQDVPATVERLLALGARADTTGPGGLNLLDLARQSKRSPRIAQALERAGATGGGPDAPQSCPFTATPIPGCAMAIAAGIGNSDLIRRGLAAGLDANQRDVAGRSLIAVALDLAPRATNAGVPVTETDSERRLLARRKDIVRMLLDHGASPASADRTGTMPLHLVASDPRLADLVEPLVAHGAPPNAVAGDKMLTPLVLAVSKGNLAAVTALLGAGADANQSMAHGVSPLMLAATQPVEYARTLLAHGAQPDATSETGLTALKAALSAGQAEVAAVLLKAGANPDYDGGAPPSPRAIAASKGGAVAALFSTPAPNPRP